MLLLYFSRRQVASSKSYLSIISNQYCLAEVFRARIRQWAENIELSITTQESILQKRYTRATIKSWANMILNLSVSHLERPIGDRNDNAEKALAYLEAAAVCIERDDDVELYVKFEHQIGRAFMARGRGDRLENVENALAASGDFREIERGRTIDFAIFLEELMPITKPSLFRNHTR